MTVYECAKTSWKLRTMPQRLPYVCNDCLLTISDFAISFERRISEIRRADSQQVAQVLVVVLVMFRQTCQICPPHLAPMYAPKILTSNDKHINQLHTQPSQWPVRTIFTEVQEQQVENRTTKKQEYLEMRNADLSGLKSLELVIGGMA